MARIGATTAVECDMPPGTRLRHHHHDAVHACVVVEGGFEERAGGRWRRLGPGHARWSPGNVDHTIDFGSSGGRCLILHLGVAPPVRARDHRFVDGASLGTLVGAIRREAFGGDPPGLVLECLALEFAARIAGTPCDRDPGTARLDRVRAWLHDHGGARTVLADLAGVAGCHPSHLTRAFRRRFGLTIGEYQRRLMVDRARALLHIEPASLATIAHRVGFSDQAHMTRMFRRYLGASPGRLRRADSVQDRDSAAA